MSCYREQTKKTTHKLIVKRLTNILFLGFSALLVSTLAHAAKPDMTADKATNSGTQCDSNITSTQYQATYQITTTDHHSNTQQNVTLILTRFNDRILYQHNEVSFEAWNKNGEYVRYFPAQNRSISYRRGDLLALNIDTDLDRQFHIISQHGLSQLSQGSTTTGKCLNQQQFVSRDAEQNVAVTWLPQMALPNVLTVDNRYQSINYQLAELKAISKDTFNQRISGYQDLDFADVGDSESDPFIAKMITQGFIQHGSSGFYTADGLMIEGGHGGHQH